MEMRMKIFLACVVIALFTVSVWGCGHIGIDSREFFEKKEQTDWQSG